MTGKKRHLKTDLVKDKLKKKKDLVHAEEGLELGNEGVARLGEDAHQHVLRQRVQRRDHRKPSHEFGDHSELDQVARLIIKKT